MSNLKRYRLSDVAQSWLRLDGHPFRLADWPMHREFYDGRYRRTLFKTSRQVGKSVTMCNFSIIECALIPHFSTFFVAPTKEHTVRFSNTRLGKIMRYSPIIHKTFLKTDLTDRVFHKQFTNGSEMLLTYASDSDERVRGPSTHRNMYDEVQDMLYDPVITVGNETMANSPHAYETYAGTPKTMENTIQYLWELSTQSEWVMKCDSCGSYQFIDTEKSIGKLGPVCLKCGAYLNPFTGQWVDMNPIDYANGEDEDTKLKGFHISQPIMPFNVPKAMEGRGEDHAVAVRRWKRLLDKFENSPITAFRNEVLGVSDAIGTRMLSKQELLDLCTDYEMLDKPEDKTFQGISFTVGGVDWSGGGTTGISRTVMWIWGFRPKDQKLVTLLYKVFPGINPVNVIDQIGTIFDSYRVQLVVGDAGEGHTANDLLRNKIGHHRVQQVQYGAQKEAIKWNGVDRWMADRTTLIDNYFMGLKRREFEFAHRDQMGVAVADILNEYEEITSSDRRVWRHSPQKPDDCLHAGLFGWLAFKMTQNDMRFYQ